ncbi:MAG: hypothetical protein ACOY3E_01605 [Pseudomonadota bacterium]
MKLATRTFILRTDAAFLGLASFGGFVADIAGSFFGKGPFASIIGQPPHAGIGFTEAHGLAFIFAVLLWRASSERSWHLTAVAVHALLGSANLAFWPLFAAADQMAMGYLTTTLHWTLVIAQLIAARSASQADRSKAS